MTDQDRNMRTLIVCYVLAIVALIPLRIVEIGNWTGGEVKVLGETEEFVGESVIDEGVGPVIEENDDTEVILPNAEL
jgi:hypothetical protein